MIKYLIAILLTTTAAYSQTIKTLGYNTTNGQIAYSGSNTLTFTNPLGFGNAATTRTNLGLGWSVLTNTDASNFRSSIGLSLAALTNTNVTNFRTDIGLGSLATNNSVPSGTNISNSILVSDGSGSSIFSTNIFPASLTITNTNGTTIIRASTNLGVRINGFTAYISGNESVPFVGTGTLGYAEGGAGNSGALVFANGNGGSLSTRWGLDGVNYLGMRGTANHFSLQGIRLYGKFTNSTNYSRIVFASDSNGMSFIRPEAAGPSATNNVLNISGLPETNQGSTNILWNDFGLIKATNVTGVPSGAATTNSLLTADGAGGSSFVSTLPRLTLASGTITNSNPALTISQTWSNSAIAFTGFNFDIANSNSAVGSKAINITVNGSNNLLGIYRDNAGSGIAAAPRFEIGSGGVSWNIRTRTGGGVGCNFDGIVGLGSSLQFGVGTTTGGDVILYRDAADTLALGRTTNAQAFRLYNTYTDSTNYERGRIAWTNNVLTIGTEKGGGGGSARTLELQVDGTTFLGASTGGTVRFGSQTTQSTTLIGWFGNCFMRPINAAAGVLTLLNSTLDGFDRLQFGGTNTNFPALKRTNTVLQVRLADDSAYTTIDAQHRLQGTAPTNSTAAGTAGDIRYDTNDFLYICVSSNTWRRIALTNW